jgi:hypothetical protein
MIMLVAPPDVLINSREYLRYQIITLHKMGVEKGVIAYFVNLDISTVNRWTERAERAERVEGDMEFKDKPRPGRPLVYDDALRHRVVAFYCQTTPLPGAGRWTLRWAKKILEITPELVGAGTGVMLSRSTLCHWENSQQSKSQTTSAKVFSSNYRS